jgi:telomere length regulation protein
MIESTQLLLLCLAHIEPSALKEISRSPKYNDGLANRLSASVDRTRFLGLIVGEAISRKVDPEGRRLSFKVPETQDATAEIWRSLIDIDDKLAPLKDLQGGIVEIAVESHPKEEPQAVSAEEFLVDGDEDLDKDLRKYAVPESDHEDSDEDPTLVSREKAPAPL